MADANQCGLSKYEDAGEGCPIGNPCTNIVGGIPARENEFPYQVRSLTERRRYVIDVVDITETSIVK